MASKPDNEDSICLSMAAKAGHKYVEHFWRHGNEDHKGRGDDFMFQFVGEAFKALVGIRYMVRQGLEDFERLNAVAGRSPYGFSAIPVPPCEIMWHGIALAKLYTISIEEAKTQAPADVVSFNNILRDAARDVVKLLGRDACSHGIVTTADTDDDTLQRQMEDSDRMRDLLYSDHVGQA